MYFSRTAGVKSAMLSIGVELEFYMYLLKKCIISLFVCTAISGAVISVGMMKNMPVFKNSEKNVIVIDPGHNVVHLVLVRS